jgi:hypothetical protein
MKEKDLNENTNYKYLNENITETGIQSINNENNFVKKIELNIKNLMRIIILLKLEESLYIIMMPSESNNKDKIDLIYYNEDKMFNKKIKYEIDYNMNRNLIEEIILKGKCYYNIGYESKLIYRVIHLIESIKENK